ncbi:hypothetical protein ACFWTE_03175 [Nocardiopsis sp. NPDC058631]|uniref:hypothetical protein n=1 Tax=Nocardiopsis sp. NPDC058631 TaxID=3346566 RepID=UPI0036549F86
MAEKHFTYDDAASRVSTSQEVGARALRAVRWFRWFVALQTVFALAFTLSIDVFGAPYWIAFALLLLASAPVWATAYRHSLSAPRHGLRNTGIAVATWFALYTLMLDPALQLVGVSSPWWWVLAGTVAASPIAACLWASSRR